MPYDEGLAQLLRDDLEHEESVTEKKMFGGLAFLQNGHMVCGTYRDRGMFRVGKEREEKALLIDGAFEMGFTGRRMGGMIEVEGEALADDQRRRRWLQLALAFVKELPPK